MGGLAFLVLLAKIPNINIIHKNRTNIFPVEIVSSGLISWADINLFSETILIDGFICLISSSKTSDVEFSLDFFKKDNSFCSDDSYYKDECIKFCIFLQLAIG